ERPQRVRRAARQRQLGGVRRGRRDECGGHGGDADHFTISSSSTSNTSVAPGLICGGRPWWPEAVAEGQTSFALPPAFICWRPSVQHFTTPFSGNVAGWPRCTELSKTVPSVSFPV